MTVTEGDPHGCGGEMTCAKCWRTVEHNYSSTLNNVDLSDILSDKLDRAPCEPDERWRLFCHAVCGRLEAIHYELRRHVNDVPTLKLALGWMEDLYKEILLGRR